MRDRLLFAWAILGSLAFVGCHPCPQCAPCPTCPTAKEIDEGHTETPTWFVLRVIDGDTLVARLEGANVERQETIRLLNINTPEHDQPGFVEATEALKGLVRGGTITLEFAEPNVEKRDGFGRLLAFAFADGVNVNIEMVREGWSKIFTKYGRGRLAAEFEKAEQAAREGRRGMWNIDSTSP